MNKLNDLPIRLGYYKGPFGQTIIKWFSNGIENIENQLKKFLKLNRKPQQTNKSLKNF